MEERRISDMYRKAEQALTAVASAVQRQDDIDLADLSELAAGISESVRRNDQLVVHAMAGPSGPPLVTNLVNVSILAAKVGGGLGYYGEEHHRLVLAGLVHDIGLFAVPQSVVTKSGRLTQDERALIEQHPELGYQLIRKAGPSWEWLAQVVRQAHERWNGQGYPNRLKGRQISELAQIIGVVDVFDALVTPRPYRRRFFPHEAVRELIVAERLAFPREVIKALAEQLSAYPMGTLVRLTTGEVGTVVSINADYPLRPILEIGGEAGNEVQKDARRLDLSRLPLVSIVETLEPPDVARVARSAGRPGERRAKPTMSDQFSSLLESLDAIANAIQGVVVSRTTSHPETAVTPASAEEWLASREASGSETADSAFQKEVVGLFALEAHEWLAQIHSALKRLGEGANGSVRPKLHAIMQHGLTNLAKSAATVHQSAIEEMASRLMVLIQDIGKPDPNTMAAAMVSLKAGLDRIAAAVRQAAGDRIEEERTPTCSDRPDRSEEKLKIEPIPSAQEATEEPAQPQPVLQPMPAEASSGPPLLNALRELQQVRSRSMQPTRDVLESVIGRAEKEPGVLTTAGVRRILTELDLADETFLDDVRRRVPRMSEQLSVIRREGLSDFVTASQLDPVVEEVEALYEAAGRVQAGMITMFLQGLRSFLLVAAYRKTTSLPQRLETVENRVQALIGMAEQWVNIGRIERAAIAEILPAA
jgi:HD-GYP domain-containing protein (c-di-GMP phosphodiesterase class II)